MSWYPGKILNGIFGSEKQMTQKETIGDWLKRIGIVERSMTPLQRQYLYKDPYYRWVVEAIDFQIKGEPPRPLGLQGARFLNLPITDLKHFYFHVPSLQESITIRPKDVEKIVEFWSQTGHVAEAKMAVQQLNQEIAQRIGYGVRPYVAPSNGYAMAWSNEAERWIVYSYKKYRKGEEVKEVAGGLDANMIFAPYDDEEFLRRIAHLLDPLPLFRASLEAKERGQISWEESFDLLSILAHAQEAEEQEREKYR